MSAAKTDPAAIEALCERLRTDEACNAASDTAAATIAALAAERDAAVARADAAVAAIGPFVDLRVQRGAHGVISKSLDGFAPMTITVTKAQMLSALAVLRLERGDYVTAP